uniref:Uncharacterized protein n=1 Tax=Rhizophora mucronata TaxID=61149 RepID=A0A2P2KAX9_RHIMU
MRFLILSSMLKLMMTYT